MPSGFGNVHPASPTARPTKSVRIDGITFAPLSPSAPAPNARLGPAAPTSRSPRRRHRSPQTFGRPEAAATAEPPAAAPNSAKPALLNRATLRASLPGQKSPPKFHPPSKPASCPQPARSLLAAQRHRRGTRFPRACKSHRSPATPPALARQRWGIGTTADHRPTIPRSAPHRNRPFAHHPRSTPTAPPRTPNQPHSAPRHSAIEPPGNHSGLRPLPCQEQRSPLPSRHPPRPPAVTPPPPRRSKRTQLHLNRSSPPTPASPRPAIG